MSKFLSGRQSNFKLGVSGYTENKTVLETTGKVGIGTTDAQSYSLFVVGDTNITGLVSATSFYGDGSNLENTGATLSAAAGTQRLVVTSLTSGTMVDAATDSDLTFNATTNTLNTDNLIVAGNLTVSGDQTILNTTQLEVEDINIGIASASTKLNDAQLDGAGITIHGSQGDKTLTWSNANSRLEFNTDLYAPNFFVGGITATGDVDFDGNLDVDGHTELDQLNVSGVSTFAGLIDANGGINATTAKVEDLTDNRIVIAGVGGELEDDANLTFNGSEFNVGSAITAYAATGIVSATAFYGDGSNLLNTGATLSATSGVERLVTTQLTSGTMVDAATDGDLTFDASNNTLNTDNIKISGGISTDGSDYGQSGQLLRSVSGGKWEWATVPGIFSVNNILNGFNVLEEGGTVGTAGSIHTLDFRGINVTATADPQPNGIATVTFSTTPTFTGVNLTGVSTITGTITAGSSEGVNGQYLRHVGTGVTWASFPTLRVTQTNTATAGQTAFNFSYNVDFLDVFVNGVKLTSSEYSANNGSQIVLNTPAFAGEIVEFHSYNITSNYGGGGGGGGGASNLTGLSDVNFPIALADDQLLQFNSSTNVWENVAVTSLPYATEAFVGLATAGISTAGLASETFVGLSTVGLASETFVGLSTTGLASEAFVGLATAGLLTSHQSLIGKANVTIGDNPPGIGTASGDLWWESDTAKGHIYYDDGSSAQWVEFNPSSGGGGGGGGGSYGNSDVDSHLNQGTASSGEVLSWNGSDYDWVAQSGGSGISTANVVTDSLAVSGIATLGTSGGARFIEVQNDTIRFKSNSQDAVIQGTGYGALNINSGGASHSVSINTYAIFSGGNGDVTLNNGSQGNTTIMGDLDLKKELVVSGISSLSELIVTGISSLSGGANVTGILTATSFVKSGGTSSQYLMADGSVSTGSGGSGITTANINADTLNVSGISTFNNDVKLLDSDKLKFGIGEDLQIYHNGNNSYIDDIGDGDLYVRSNRVRIGKYTGEDAALFNADGSVELYYDDSKKFETTNTGAVVTGILTATTFSGSGASLTNLPAGQLTGSLPAIDGSALTNISSTHSDIVSVWTIGASGFSDYTLTGPGLTGAENDPTIYLVRGQTYRFTNNSGGSHPFQIRYNSNGTAYSDGITYPGGAASAASGNIDWNVQYDAPDVLYYQCTNHSAMLGKIIILGDVVNEGSWTASAGSAQTIDTITGVANNAIKTAEYTIHIENGSNMQAQKVLVMQDGTTAFSQEYAIMHKSGLLVSMSATISGGNLLLQATPETGVSGTTTYKVTRQTMR